MNKHNSLKLLAATIIGSSVALSGMQAQETLKINVPAKEKSVDTGIKVEKGDRINVIDATGYFVASGPDGGKGTTFAGNINTTKSSAYFQFQNAGEHALVVWVGDQSNHVQVRKDIATEAPADGNVFFAINDGNDHYHDNKGGFDVSYQIIKKDKGCSPRSGEKVEIKWTNKTGVPIRVNWVNFDCTEEPSDRLIQPDGIFDGISYTGHVFIVREDAANKDLGVITVKPSIATFDIFQ